MKGLFLISVELVIGARWKCSAHTRRCLSPLLCRDHLRSWELLLSTRFLLPAPARRGWAAPATTKLQQEAGETARTAHSAKLVLTGIPPPRERLRWAQIRNPLVTDRAWALFTSSQTQLRHWGRRRMVWRLPEQQRERIISRSQSWCLRRWGFACSSPGTPGCGWTLHSRDNSLGKGAQPDSYNPINTTSRGHPKLFLKGDLKTEQRYAHKHMPPAALWTLLMAKSTKPRRAGFGVFSPYVSLKILLFKFKK